MTTALDILAAFFLLSGSLLALTGALGIARFPDTLARMHAATKPQMLGLLLMLAGAALRIWGSADVGMLVLTALFAGITVPVVAHRVGRVAHREGLVREDLLVLNQMEPNRDD
jgi:multicomponent Na+:H+ antiporter subunit G